MPSNYDIIIIGAGHNGLVAAGYLARAGLKPLVLERRDLIGGAAVTEEIHPGFRCSTLAHALGPLLPQIIKELHLKQHGLTLIEPDVRLLALGANGDSLCVYNDKSKTIAELAKLSSSDAKSYPEFEQSFARIGRVLKPLLSLTPPALDKPAFGEVFNLGKLGLAFRGLGKKDEYRLLRWGPMAVADLVAEWFENELLRAAVAARGVFGEFAGPWSAGTSAGLLFQAAANEHPIPPSTLVKGGMGALSETLAKAATSAGAVIRTGVDVRHVRVKDGRAIGIQLATGEEIDSRAVASSADPKSTFLKMLDPVELTPGFLNKMRNYRAVGVSAKVNLALSGLPKFTALNGDSNKLSGRIHVGYDIDYLERAFDAAKYGEFSPHPYLDITIPSLKDDSLAPPGGHVMSIYVQYAPYKLAQGDWDGRREELGDTVVKTLSTHIPDLNGLIVARQVITPLDLEGIMD